jgi:hypothetical protein
MAQFVPYVKGKITTRLCETISGFVYIYYISIGNIHGKEATVVDRPKQLFGCRGGTPLEQGAGKWGTIMLRTINLHIFLKIALKGASMLKEEGHRVRGWGAERERKGGGK